MILLLSGTWAAPPAYAGGCDPAAIEASLAAAETAFPSGDLNRIEESVLAVRKGMACTREALGPKLCSRIHRVYALHRWLQNDTYGAQLSLRAMLHADPNADLPDEMVSERHPLRGALILAEEALPTWTEAPGTGWVLVDGLRTGAIPVNQPYLLQPVKDDGRAMGARLVDKAPTESGRLLEPVLPALTDRRVMRVAGIGLGIVSAGLYGAAWATHGAYDRAVLAEDNTRIGRAHAATNVLSVTSLATFGLGAGVVVSSELFSAGRP